jgi:hypothetical protein
MSRALCLGVLLTWATFIASFAGWSPEGTIVQSVLLLACSVLYHAEMMS